MEFEHENDGQRAAQHFSRRESFATIEKEDSTAIDLSEAEGNALLTLIQRMSWAVVRPLASSDHECSLMLIAVEYLRRGLAEQGFGQEG